MARPKHMVGVTVMGMITWALRVLVTGPSHMEAPVATEVISTRRALATKLPILSTVPRQGLATARPHPVDVAVMEMLKSTRAPRVLATKPPSQIRMAQPGDLTTRLSLMEVLVATEKVAGTGRALAIKAPTPSTIRRRDLAMARPSHSVVLAVGTETGILARLPSINAPEAGGVAKCCESCDESNYLGVVGSSNCETAEFSVRIFLTSYYASWLGFFIIRRSTPCTIGE